jgi:hypothetical protein
LGIAVIKESAVVGVMHRIQPYFQEFCAVLLLHRRWLNQLLLAQLQVVDQEGGVFLRLSFWPYCSSYNKICRYVRYYGLIAGTLCFVIWGLLPIYWKWLQTVPAHEIICHRMVWSLILTLGLVFILRRQKIFWQGICNRSHLAPNP